jgi:hypothetical protein
MNKLVSAFAALAMGLVTVSVTQTPTAAQGTHSSEKPGMFEMRQDQYFRRHGNRAYYNGHRGYEYRRSGYQNYNGFWFPAAAFLGAAVIGSVIQNGGTGSHADWCHNRYRSYRYSDNTFQPNYGPRRVCR